MTAASTRWTWRSSRPAAPALDTFRRKPAPAVPDQEISIQSLAPAGAPPYRVFLDQPTVANVVQAADGKVLCDTQRMLLRTETPEVCTGRDGELEWETGASDAVVFKQLKAGTCSLSAGTPEGFRQTFDLVCVAK